MAARRKKRGRQHRRGRFGFLYKLLSIALILAAIIAGCVVFFRVDTITVAGNSRYTAEQIIDAAEVERGDNLFTLDKFKISKQILTRLPYVASVSITRSLPDALDIKVSECAGAASLEGEGAYWILNAGGKFVERTDAAGAASVPPVTGLTAVAPIVGTKLEVPEEQELKLAALTKLMAALEARGMAAQVQSYDLTAVNVVLVGYAGRFTLKLPMSGTDYTKETKTVQVALERLAANDSGIIDFTLEGDPHLIPYS